MQLYLIRHLPTVWNDKGLLQGSKDIPIDTNKLPLFTTHIEENKRILQENEPFDIVLTSSLKRTQQTAKLYGIQDPIIESDLDELNFGRFEGQLKKTLIAATEESWYETPISIDLLGETMEHFQQRLFHFIEKYNTYEKLLIFGHGSWIRACRSIILTGNINEMNKIHVNNNELIHLTVPKERQNKN